MAQKKVARKKTGRLKKAGVKKKTTPRIKPYVGRMSSSRKPPASSASNVPFSEEDIPTSRLFEILTERAEKNIIKKIKKMDGDVAKTLGEIEDFLNEFKERFNEGFNKVKDSADRLEKSLNKNTRRGKRG